MDEVNVAYDTNHTFAVCAYKESPHLETCLKSLLSQSVKTNILISTSTPNAHIEGLAKKYHLPLYFTNQPSDIQDDWNYAYNLAKTEWVTVAHQDDIYNKHYVEKLLEYTKTDSEDITMVMTDYLPIKGGKIGKRDINSKLRRFFRLPLKNKTLAGRKFVRRRCLSFGNSICCPTVTYHKKKLGDTVFTSKLKFSLDWDTFTKLAGYPGRFCYIDIPLTYYRVYEGATTKEFIVNHTREADDIYMFRQFWPEWICKIIMKFYINAYKTYD